MTIRVLPAVLLVAAFMQAAPGALPADVKKAAERITAVGLKRDLDYLASDELKGRNTPSPDSITPPGSSRPGSRRQAWRRRATRARSPALHDARIARSTTAAASVEIGGRRFAFGDDFVLAVVRKAGRGTFPVVYVGHGWTVPGKQIDPFAGVDVKGKVVVAHGPRALPKGVDIPLDRPHQRRRDDGRSPRPNAAAPWR